MVVDDPVGQTPSISVLRAVQLGMGLAQEHAVVLCTTLGATMEVPGVTLRTLSGLKLRSYAGLASLTIATRTAAGRLPYARTGRLCVDLGAFLPSDFLAADSQGTFCGPAPASGEYLRLTNAGLRLGDFFLCASEDDRPSWLGALAAAGRIRPSLYDADPKLRRLLDVAPLANSIATDNLAPKIPDTVRRYCESPWRNPRPGR